MALHVFVIKETELEDPQDLRARSRKFLNLTNERKNMSTKTLRKRIALVAVAALGAGVLSVAPANATALANTAFTTEAASNPIVCSIDATSAGAEAIVLPLGVDFVLSGTAANMQNSDVYTISMPGTTIQSFAAQGVSGRTDVVSADRSSISSTAGASATPAHPTSVTFRAATAGDYVLTVSEKDGGGASADIEAISVSWVATCANNVYSAADSLIQVRDDNSAAGTTTSTDEPTGLIRSNGETAYIALATEDAYGVALSGAGSLVASATNGAVINWDSAPTVQTSNAYLATRGASGTELYVTQGAANKDKPLTTTVTITLDGKVIGTKTISFRGAAAKIVVSDVTVGKTGDSSTGRGYWAAVVQDSAGNNLLSATVEDDATANAASNAGLVATVAVSAVSHTDGTKASTAGTGTFGRYTCVASGTTVLNVKHVTNSITGASIKGSFPVACGNVLDTWTISMDKASYAPGEIATLTVSGKDAKGFAVNSFDDMGTIEYSFGGMTAITAPTTTDSFDSALGAKTYKFSVGTSEGAFVGTFKIAGATDTAAKTVQYKVAGSAGVTNADVLKAIVSLIASINKQIAALQKALLRR